MPERNFAVSYALTSSPLNRGLEAVRHFIEGVMPDITQLSFPIPIAWRPWGNHNQTGMDVQPAASIEPLQWREVGWIFRQGQCIAIEGKGPEIRARITVA